MRTDTGQAVSRHDYTSYPYALRQVELQFELDADCTRVRCLLSLEREKKARDDAPLILHGQDLSLLSLAMDGAPLGADDYRIADERLTLHPQADRFQLEIVNNCHPRTNSTLMGLYESGGKLFTQCEAEGFRRITWFPDRPDVMAPYRVTMRADKHAYPLLLSNGNLISERDLPDGRHEAVWEDPHPKPSYLFALVAGDFACREQTIRTQSGRQALLQIYSDHEAADKTEWALDCLIRSVQWDEKRYGLELDLDRFMVVATHDFNMGAMENKGLNIFNAAYVLADKDSATDSAYRAIEAVIGHEYFHNWTGNRVTCRDWFQLSLKEGLTVFRDQEFSADMLAEGLSGPEAASARAVKRIDDVNTLRNAQFPEDAGPMAHPIRPESYQEIGNFYTATVYEKGAEVIRMQHTLLGEQGFREGMDEYFRRHDGQAVTCDDFVSAMETVYRRHHPSRSLEIFRRWYSQAGTPRVAVTLAYDARAQQATVTLRQRNPAVGIETLAAPPLDKPPLHIPLAIGFLDQSGRAMSVEHEASMRDALLLELAQAEQAWTFTQVPEKPVLSLPRNFSAPVIIEYERSDDELVLLALHDTDPFARWEAGQEAAMRQLLALTDGAANGEDVQADPGFLRCWEQLLQDPALTAAYRARVLTLPSEKEVLQRTQPMTPLAVSQAHRSLRRQLGAALAEGWLRTYHAYHERDAAYRPDPISAGKRSLKNLALSYLTAGGHLQAPSLAHDQYYQAGNMTDRMGGLTALVHDDASPHRAQALKHFYDQWQDNPLIIDKWFALQATAPGATLEDVLALMEHPAFSLRNPNRARSLVFQFCLNNLRAVHQPGGYRYWADQVIALNALNPEIAARLARAFDNWAKFAEPHRLALRAELERIQAQPSLSRNVAEIVSKALNI